MTYHMYSCLHHIEMYEVVRPQQYFGFVLTLFSDLCFLYANNRNKLTLGHVCMTNAGGWKKCRVSVCCAHTSAHLIWGYSRLANCGESVVDLGNMGDKDEFTGDLRDG